MFRGIDAPRHAGENYRMRQLACYILNAVPLVFLCGPIAFAEDAAPKKFYKRDYASAPGAEGREYDSPTSASQNVRGLTQPSGGESSGKTGKITDPEKKRRRVIISVFVNSSDKEHFQKTIAEILSLCDSQKAFISTVQHIGDYNNVTPEQKEELSRRDITIIASSRPPPEANVTTSPTWVITARNGVHIAEGIFSISHLFNEYGDYDPKLANKTGDRSTVEGF